jgi:tight adherence protein C
LGSSFFVGLLTFLGVTGFALLLMRPVFAQYVDSYAVRVRPRKSTEESSAEKPHDSLLLNLMRSIGELVLSMMPALADRRTVQLLTEANYRTASHLAIYIGIKVTFVAIIVFLGLMSASSNPMMLLMCLPAVGFGWYMPNFFLAGRSKKRQDVILRELPTIIDLLIVCAQAGLGLLMAVDKVAKETKESCPTLAIELEQLINDVKIFAKSVPIAMREMGERCGVDDLISMASALIAAESKGADISYPLRQQGEALRDRLKRKKEEEAAKVPVKMIPVIMMFVMPLLMCPMLGPAVITIMQALGPMMNGGGGLK